MDEGFNLDGFDDLLMDGAAGAIVPRSDQHPPPANNNPTSTSQPPHQPPPFPHTPAVALQAIPGPAGRLAAQLPSPNATNTFEDEEEMYNEPQENVNECEAWRAALDALDVPCTDVHSVLGHSIQHVIDKSTSTRVPQLLALVASISQPLANGDAFVVVKDHTGSMGACFHSTTLAHSLGITPGAALLLHNVPVLKVGHDALYLCVQPSSIAQVFPATFSSGNTTVQHNAHVNNAPHDVLSTNPRHAAPTNWGGVLLEGPVLLAQQPCASASPTVPYWQVVPATQPPTQPPEGIQVVACTPTVSRPAATPTLTLFDTPSAAAAAVAAPSDDDDDPLALHRMTRTKKRAPAAGRMASRASSMELSCAAGGSDRVPCTDVTNNERGVLGGGVQPTAQPTAQTMETAQATAQPMEQLSNNPEQPPAKRQAVQPTPEADILVLMDGLDDALFG